MVGNYIVREDQLLTAFVELYFLYHYYLNFRKLHATLVVNPRPILFFKDQ